MLKFKKNLAIINELFIKYKLNIVVNILVILAFIVLTLCNDEMQRYTTDELWSWDIASDLNFIETIKLMRYEGHAFLWYLILKPFTYFEQLYPYILKYINWFFAFLAVCILYFKSPINKFLKIIIIFSNPFLHRFPVEGRCYSIGIFFLFLLTVLYKNKTKYPILYSVLIFLTANTSLIAAVGAFAFTCLFLYEMIKKYISEKNNIKKLFLPSLILILCALSLYIQWHNPIYPEYAGTVEERLAAVIGFYVSYKYEFLKYFAYFIFLMYTPITLIIFIIDERKKAIPYILFTFPTIAFINLFMIFIYFGHYTHMYFVYIYLIIIYWIYIEDNKPNRLNRISYKAISILLLLLSLLFFSGLKDNCFWSQNFSIHTKTAEQIKKIIPKESTIILYFDFCQGILPYIKNDYNLIDLNGYKIPSLESFQKIYHQKPIQPSEVIPTGNKQYYLIHHEFIKDYEKENALMENYKLSKYYTIYKLKNIEK